MKRIDPRLFSMACTMLLTMLDLALYESYILHSIFPRVSVLQPIHAFMGASLMLLHTCLYKIVRCRGAHVLIDMSLHAEAMAKWQACKLAVVV